MSKTFKRYVVSDNNGCFCYSANSLAACKSAIQDIAKDDPQWASCMSILEYNPAFHDYTVKVSRHHMFLN